VTGTDAIQISKTFDFNSGTFDGNGLLTTLSGSTTTLAASIPLLNKNWNNYGTIMLGGSAPVSVTAAAKAMAAASVLPTRNWNNYGTIISQGQDGSVSSYGQNIILTNKSSGIFNIGGDNPLAVREISLGAFYNQGTVNLSGGILKFSVRV